jgi:hypothetical protein
MFSFSLSFQAVKLLQKIMLNFINLEQKSFDVMPLAAYTNASRDFGSKKMKAKAETQQPTLI